MVFTSFLRPS